MAVRPMDLPRAVRSSTRSENSSSVKKLLDWIRLSEYCVC